MTTTKIKTSPTRENAAVWQAIEAMNAAVQRIRNARDAANHACADAEQAAGMDGQDPHVVRPLRHAADVASRISSDLDAHAVHLQTLAESFRA